MALNILKFYPLPNRPADNISGANNFRSNYVTALTRNNITAKVDHNLGTKDKINARYLYNSDNTANTSVYADAAADTRIDAERHQQYWYGSWTRILSPSLINDFRVTYANRINHQITKGLGKDYPTKLGLNGVPNDAFPQFTVAGFATLGSNQQERRQLPIEQYQFVNNVSWVRGKHSFKFGAEARPARNCEVNSPTVSGAFGFATTPTGLPGNAATGIGLASLLLGFPTTFDARQTQLLDRSNWYLAAFAQDDWSLRSDLTLNIGLRWETDTPIIDKNNRMNSFDLHAINPRYAVSNAAGSYDLKAVPEGQHEIALRVSELPTDFEPGSEAKHTVVINTRRMTRLDFEVFRLGQICVNVLAPAEISLDNLVIRLRPTARYTTPEPGGSFCFYNVQGALTMSRLKSQPCHRSPLLTVRACSPSAWISNEARAWLSSTLKSSRRRSRSG